MRNSMAAKLTRELRDAYVIAGECNGAEEHTYCDPRSHYLKAELKLQTLATRFIISAQGVSHITGGPDVADLYEYPDSSIAFNASRSENKFGIAHPIRKRNDRIAASEIIDRNSTVVPGNGKHTPGPWMACHRSINAKGWEDEQSGLGWEIMGPPEPLLRGQFAKASDARLIAAAPDLLEALQNLAGPFTCVCQSRNESHSDICKSVKVALQKARGF